jgi:hypothetical protein
MLRPVDWEPKVGVLDQEDLLAQGIRVSQFIPGAKDVDALGSCTANATTGKLSSILSPPEFVRFTGSTSAAPYDDVVAAEKGAIRFYHTCTDQTGKPAEEWPPTDCGSTGAYVVQELVRQGLASGAKIAVGATNIVSLLQQGSLIVGQPFLNAWEEPNAAGFIDGNGSVTTLKQQIAGGIAGGHETILTAIEKLVLTRTGAIDAAKTIIRFRNSWAKGWGDNGSYRAHLSTYIALSGYCDFRLVLPKVYSS